MAERVDAGLLCRTVIVAIVLVGVAWAAVAGAETRAETRDYSEAREPCRLHEPHRQPFFGDTHVHTVYSFDANGQDTRTTPREAYRFARGEPIGLQPWGADGQPGRTVRLRRPLDFTVLSDHAELLGEIRACSTPGSPAYGSDLCFLHQRFKPVTFGFFAVRNLIVRRRFEFCGPGGSLCLDEAKVVWKDIQAAAEEAYDRTAECAFSSFVGYEWTASVGRGANLHRNVVFRNDKVPALPPSWVETPSAHDLWARLQAECVDGQPGCDALTIPHNSNLSGPGLMFASAKLEGPEGLGLEVDAEEAKRRRRMGTSGRDHAAQGRQRVPAGRVERRAVRVREARLQQLRGCPTRGDPGRRSVRLRTSGGSSGPTRVPSFATL